MSFDGFRQDLVQNQNLTVDEYLLLISSFEVTNQWELHHLKGPSPIVPEGTIPKMLRFQGRLCTLRAFSFVVR